jgi:flagellar basal-body rod modification protein FlgD
MAMMGIKNGTKAFSTAPQNEITKSSGVQFEAARAMNGDSEAESIGDIANKIADPNWVDPSRKPRAVGSDKMDKEAFMKMMLAQMKHQDPTNPMQSHELAAQLAQFSSVEQLQNVNETLTEMKNSQKPTESIQALNFIGKAVSGDSSKISRLKGDKAHDISFQIAADAKEGVVRIRDAGGDIVRTVNMKEMKKGENNFTWNGLDDKGSAAPAGEYQVFIEATAASGAKLAARTEFEGQITGVNYTPEGPVLMVGNQTVKLKDVKRIIDPSLMKNGQNSKNEVQVDLKNQGAALENSNKDEKVAGDAPITPTNLLDKVGMSRELMAKFEKETKPSK